MSSASGVTNVILVRVIVLSPDLFAMTNTLSSLILAFKIGYIHVTLYTLCIDSYFTISTEFVPDMTIY